MWIYDLEIEQLMSGLFEILLSYCSIRKVYWVRHRDIDLIIACFPFEKEQNIYAIYTQISVQCWFSWGNSHIKSWHLRLPGSLVHSGSSRSFYPSFCTCSCSKGLAELRGFNHEVDWVIRRTKSLEISPGNRLSFWFAPVNNAAT